MLDKFSVAPVPRAWLCAHAASAIGAAEGCSDALLGVEDGAQGLPAAMNAVFCQAFANDVHERVRQYGDEQVDLNAVFAVVINRAQVRVLT